MSPALLIVLVLALLAVVVTFVVGYAVGSAGRKPPRELLAALDARDALIDDLRETAWDHRDLDPHLSTIVIDKIRTAGHRKELP
jgi:hypothetical protein